MSEKPKYFVTVDWCNKGRRGVFCDPSGGAFISEDKPHTEDEMAEILGMFCLILEPKSLPFTESEVAEYRQWHPLAEYTNHYGIAVKEDSPCPKP